MRNLEFKLIVFLCAIVLSFPAQARIIVASVDGVLLPGVDTEGIIGDPGANLAGLPFSYTLYQRESDTTFPGGGEFGGRIFAMSGRIGDLRVPYQYATGSIGRLETPEEPTWIRGLPNGNYPGVVGHFYGVPNYLGLDLEQYEYINFYAPVLRGSFKIADGDIQNRSVVFVHGPVPEPSTWIMLLVGFGVLGVVVRRRRRADRQIGSMGIQT